MLYAVRLPMTATAALVAINTTIKQIRTSQVTGHFFVSFKGTLG